ncbi:MAG TPA: tripartite tricarboxylate transporter substrate binding protein [Burkholderiales bacterium]|nr:tripartite tricarboxylate transporter substrate binding protein [Burkholderiales bacterium]
MRLLLNFFGCILLASTALCHAQGQYPARPITLLVPWVPGGGSDIALRALAEGAGKHLGQRIVVENKPGAGGALAAQHMATNAKPDGYTLSQLPLGVFRLPHMVKTQFNPLTDLTWILNIAGYQFGTSVRTDSPWKTWEELIAYVKANPGKVSYASPGAGTSLHLVMEDLTIKLGLNWLHVPYKGSAESVVALRGLHVQIQAGSPPWELVEAGQVRTLVMWSNERNPRLPNVPTLKELYGIVANSPWGIGGPKGMDPKVVKVIHDAFKRAAEEPAFLKVLDRLSMERYYMAGEEYTKWMLRAYDDEKNAVERLGLNK